METKAQEVEAGPVEKAFLGTVTPTQKQEADSVEEAFLGTVTSSKDKAWSVCMEKRSCSKWTQVLKSP